MKSSLQDIYLGTLTSSSADSLAVQFTDRVLSFEIICGNTNIRKKILKIRPCLLTQIRSNVRINIYGRLFLANRRIFGTAQEVSFNPRAKPGVNSFSLKRIVDEELLTILRGELVPGGGDTFVRKISRYDDLWEEIRLNTPTPFQPHRSTLWDQPLASQRPPPIRSHCLSLLAQGSEIDVATPVQPPVGAERSSSNPSQLEPRLANISTANPTSTQRWAGWNPKAKEYPTQRWAGWNPTAKEYYPSSSLNASSRHVSPTDTLPTNTTPTTSPASQQGNHAPHSGPTNTRHVMQPAAVPAAVIWRASHPLQAPSFNSGHPILPQHAAATAVRGLSIASSAFEVWRANHPNAGPVREVLSQTVYGLQEQTLHQEELEFRKRVEKEEAAMRAGRVRPLY